MKKIEPYTGFEQGPIRPPSEAGSLLIRITRNCPWNFCTFCGIYKGTKFSKRPVDHVLKDIDKVHGYVDAILKTREGNYSAAQGTFSQMNKRAGKDDLQALHAARNFLANDMESIFLQDGNSLIIKSEDLIRILNHLKQAFPSVERITSYARSHTIARISDENLSKIAEAGLNRIHIGMESGSDAILKKVKKGSDKKTQVLAGQKVKRAGMELSEYYMPGLGGKALSEENAVETADALNQINPDFIRVRTLALPDGTSLTEQYKTGGFDKIGEIDTARELLLFLESLDGIESTVKSDHILNLFPEVDGKLPNDKGKIMAPVKEFLTLNPNDQMLYCLGRRTHHMASPSDIHDPVKRRYAEQMRHNLGATPDNMDAVIDSIIKQFI
jgi:radical SAM superfamily enzyme YgiQ (UPF0313 family)